MSSPSFEKKITVNVQTTLKQRKGTKSVLETRAGTVSNNITEEDLGHDIEPAVSRTMRQERTGITKLVKETSTLWSSYDAEQKRFEEYHDLGVSEYLSWKEVYILVNSSYNVQSSQKYHHAV